MLKVIWSSAFLFFLFLDVLTMKGKAFFHKGRNSCFLAKSIAKSYVVLGVLVSSITECPSYFLLEGEGVFHKRSNSCFLAKSIAKSYGRCSCFFSLFLDVLPNTPCDEGEGVFPQRPEFLFFFAESIANCYGRCSCFLVPFPTYRH